MLYFCTIFDSNYLSRGLTMFKSLVKHCEDFHLFIVCLDQELFNVLTTSEYKNITPIQLAELEYRYPELLIVKSKRTYVEYIFTLSPYLALNIIDSYNYVDKITTLDADLYFFSDPTDLITQNNFSIAITPHNFKTSYSKHIKYGKYNVSFQTFRNDETGLKCLNKWKNECLYWCYDKYEKERYADQKYLDSWITEFNSVCEYSTGAGIAPWNIRNKDTEIDSNGNVMINGERLVYYHFHGLRNISDNLFSLGLVDYRVIKRKKIIATLYTEYISELTKNTTSSSIISRRMHAKLGRPVYLFFLADLYKFKKGKLNRIYNLSLLRMFYSYLNSLI